jgi:hypothetical protein
MNAYLALLLACVVQNPADARVARRQLAHGVAAACCTTSALLHPQTCSRAHTTHLYTLPGSGHTMTPAVALTVRLAVATIGALLSQVRRSGGISVQYGPARCIETAATVRTLAPPGTMAHAADPSIPVSPVMQLHLYAGGCFEVSTTHGLPLAHEHNWGVSVIKLPPWPAVLFWQITAPRTPDWLVNVCHAAWLPLCTHRAYLLEERRGGVRCRSRHAIP